MTQRVDPKWSRFGLQVRRLREQAGVTQGQLSKALSISPAMLSAMERGVRGTKTEYVDQIDHALSTGGKVRVLWDRLHVGSALADYVVSVVSLERRASEISEYHPLLIPGLLQTADYARTLIRLGLRKATSGEIDEQVRLRMERQEILEGEQRPRLYVVLDEGALRRPVGGREVMRGQLDRLIEASNGTQTVIQVIPAETELHPGLDGAFRLIAIPAHETIVYEETRTSGGPVTDPTAVDDYIRHYGDLRGLALPPVTSRRLLETTLGDFQ